MKDSSKLNKKDWITIVTASIVIGVVRGLWELYKR